MKLWTLKKMSTFFTLLVVMISTQPIAAHSHDHENKLSYKLKKAFNIVIESNRFWRHQSSFFLPEIIVIDETDPALKMNLLNALNAQEKESAHAMGKFYSRRSCSNSSDAELIANLINEFALARQTYQVDLLTGSGNQAADYAHWNSIGEQLAQALTKPNPESDSAVVRTYIGQLIAEQGIAIQKLTAGDFSEAINHLAEGIRIGIKTGTYLGRAIVLKEHILDSKTFDDTILKSFGE